MKGGYYYNDRWKRRLRESGTGRNPNEQLGDIKELIGRESEVKRTNEQSAGEGGTSGGNQLSNPVPDEDEWAE